MQQQAHTTVNDLRRAATVCPAAILMLSLFAFLISVFPSRGFSQTHLAGPIHSFVLQEGGDADWDDDEAPEFLPGLLARFETPESTFTRVDDDLLFAGSDTLTDPRLEGVNFKATWSGWLYAKDNGDFKISVFAKGKVAIHVNELPVLEVNSQEAGWYHSNPIPLTFGRQQVRVVYESRENEPRLGVYWSGPSFGLEPITSRHWSHDNTGTNNSLFEIGQQLSRGLRCNACHRDPGANEPKPLNAPALTHLQENLRPSWLVSHLQANAPSDRSTIERRMPYFELDRNSAMAISAALFAASKPSVAPPDYVAQLVTQQKNRRKKQPAIRTNPDAKAGGTLFASRGCLACHSLGELGESSNLEQALFDGGDLSTLATKRTKAFLQRWLEDASTVNADHRMPQFDFSPNEHLDLVAFLNQQGVADSRNDTTAAGDASRGIGLIARHRCAACHTLPDSLNIKAETNLAKPLGAESNWDQGCLTSADPSQQIPGYGLSATHRQALQAYYSQRRSEPAPLTGKQVLAENNCLGCHQRDLQNGISSHLPLVASQFPETAARLAALSPPAITGVGDKLNTNALANSILRKSPLLREWLDVRMPKYQFSRGHLVALTEHLVDHDRIPPGLKSEDIAPTQSSQAEKPKLPALSDKAIQLGAARLVTSEGFGCQSCHQIGDFPPPKVDLKARGTNLSLLGDRIRESWFQRWVRNPSRIVPRMEMPAIQVAAKGVLNDDLDLQLDALWETLNDPEFTPPRPNPARVVRTYNQPDLAEAARLVTCVIETEHKNYIRPLAIGLPNRQNFLFDLESGHLAGWWLGDTASQYTRGKTWYWELGNPFLNTPADSDPRPLESLELVDELGNRWLPKPQGQVAVQLDRIEHVVDGLKWSGRIHFVPTVNQAKSNGQMPARLLDFSQTYTAGMDESVVQSELSLPSGWKVNIRTFGTILPADSGATFSIPGAGTAVIATLTSKPEIINGDLLLSGGDSNTIWRTTYRSRLPGDSFPKTDIPLSVVPQTSLNCVPGYEAIRLPIPLTEMPVSFAFDQQGRFFTGSLKGNVSQLHDDDGDGLHDRIEKISDEYPTPYGMQVTPQGDLDVLTKFALIRFSQRDKHGNLASNAKWTATVVADGWGYTADYHDWAVGLEKDPSGSYWMALPCQQDDRSEAAAYLRGHAIKLLPIDDASDENRRYRLESFAAGLRFPMGIVLSDEGDLFTTDNQGNYNPFNELNHLREGKRYGFINKLENRDGFSPPFESPAINIPHPWTRSVNGICWLQTPEQVRKATGSNLFGAFEGHLLGCEMNGRSLIRMSLQRVGDTFQGAAYNFSLPGLDAADTFVGPIVCEVAPNGDIYVGSLQDSGWGGGQNTGAIARLRPNPSLPVGIAEVRATATGFEIDFTQPVDGDKARLVESYQMRSYRRVSTPAYGGDDQDERSERPEQIEVSENGRRVTLTMNQLREGAVYEINIGSIGKEGETLFPAQAHYTMRAIPK